MEKKTNSKAIASFVLAIVGLFFAGLICGIIAIIMGGNAMKEINQETENGYGLAQAAKIIGVIEVCISGLALVVITLCAIVGVY